MRVRLFTFVAYFAYIQPDGKAYGCHVMPKEGDDCEPDITKWYYNQEELKCQNFMYGECESRGNTFDSKKQCEDSCKGAGKRPQRPAPRPTPQPPWEAPPKQPPHRPSPPRDHPPRPRPPKRHPPRPRPPRSRPPAARPPPWASPKRRPTWPDMRPKRTRQPVKQESGEESEERKRKPPKQKRPKNAGHCGARPRRGGNCDDSSEKWFFNAGFYTCSRVKAEKCPTVGSFFDSCEECQQKCLRHRKHLCDFLH
nr:papilin-like [Rhipicephalus microplus]